MQICGPAQFAELGHLVLAESLGWEEIESSRGGILDERLERRHQIAQRFAGRGGRNDHHVLAGPDGLYRFGLVTIQGGDAAALEAGSEAGAQPLRHRHEIGLPDGHAGVVQDSARHRRLSQKSIQYSLNAGRLVVPHEPPQRERTC